MSRASAGGGRLHNQPVCKDGAVGRRRIERRRLTGAVVNARVPRSAGQEAAEQSNG